MESIMCFQSLLSQILNSLQDRSYCTSFVIIYTPTWTSHLLPMLVRTRPPLSSLTLAPEAVADLSWLHFTSHLG